MFYNHAFVAVFRIYAQRGKDSAGNYIVDHGKSLKKIWISVGTLLVPLTHGLGHLLQIASQQEIVGLRGMIDEDKFRMERIEEQMNDITELNQHEVTNLKQVT